MKRQRGQVLLLCLILALVGSAAMFFVFDAGQIVSAKSRTVTAADTAAFSAASWRARVLNYNAYSNRAIIAQEVAVAQAITLESWAYYFENFTATVEKSSWIYPPIQPIAEAIAEAAELNRKLAQATAATEISIRDAPGYGYKTLLAQSQRVMHYTASGFGLSAIAQEVAGTGDSRIKAYVLPISSRHRNFVKRYESDPDRQRIKKLVERSLDKFTAGSRDANFNMLLPSACPIGSTEDRFMHYKKRGGTRLAPGLDRWEAADTGSVQSSVLSRGIFGGGKKCKPMLDIPVGWGSAQMAVNQAQNEIISNPGEVEINPAAFDYAEDLLADSDRPEHRGTGIARVYDLNYEGLKNKRFPKSRVVVLTKLKLNKVWLARRLVQGGRRLTSQPKVSNDEIRAVAVAEVYFKRPPGHGSTAEYASLYNPFWQVRLSSATQAEKLVASHAP